MNDVIGSTFSLEECLNDEVLLCHVWDRCRCEVTGIVVVDLEDIGVEFFDQPFDGIGLSVFDEECLVSFKIFAVLDGCLVSFNSEYCVRRYNKTCLQVTS